MPPIPPHRSDTRDGAWDASANERNVLTDQPASYFAKIYAWRDPEMDERLKSAYRFIHHFVSADGDPGPASIRACRAAIGVLNGARGGTTIPDRDRRGVWRHVARHLLDAGLEPAELRRGDEELELLPVELETSEDQTTGTKGRITGIAWDFSEPDITGDLFAPGAFINLPADVPLLWQHRAEEVIGRARCYIEGDQLMVEAQLDLDDPIAQRAYDKVRKGLIDGLSVGFTVQEADVDKLDGHLVRRITKAKLWEVSIVTFAAHPSARVIEVRSAAQEKEEKHMEFTELVSRLDEERAARARIEKELERFALELKNAKRPADSVETIDLRRWLEDNDDVKALMAGKSRSAILHLPWTPAQLLTKATITTGSITGGGGVVRERVPEIVTPGRRRLFVRDLFTTIPTDANAIEYVRCTAEGGTVSPQTEAGTKSELSHNFQTGIAYVRTIPAWVPATRQVLEDIAGMESFIRDSVAYRVRETEEAQILTGDGTGTNIYGLATQATAFDVNLAGTLYHYADCIARAAQQIEEAGFPAPDFVVVSPRDYWNMRLALDRENNYIFGPPSADPGAFTMFGLTVIRSTALSSPYFLVGSSRPDCAVIREKSGLTVEISTEHADYFVRNMVAFKAEVRIALVVFQPGAYVYGALARSLN